MFQSVAVNVRKRLGRRTLLRGTGVSMSLPYLTAMQPAHAAADKTPRRFVAMTLGLGLHGPNLNPGNAGREYTPSKYLKDLQDLRNDFTVISGSSHPGVSGGHRAEASLLTAQPVGTAGRAKNTISIDQFLAKHLGGETRFPSLVLSNNGSSSPAYTENGAMIPAQASPSRLFAQLFVDEPEAERAEKAARVREGRSIMDLVAEDARRLTRELGTADKQRLDAYFTSVRDLELRLAENEAWAHRPKPKVDVSRPIDVGNPNDFVGRQRLMSDMIALALQTDSTRFISFHLGGSGGALPLEGVSEGYHSLSHHGLDGDKLDQLAIVETAILNAWGDFLRSLQKVEESDGTLLDQTSVLLTSNLGNASNHSNKNMPVLLAGGSFEHGQHLAFDTRNNYPLSNLFVSLLQQQGLQTDQFASGKATMTGLRFS